MQLHHRFGAPRTSAQYSADAARQSDCRAIVRPLIPDSEQSDVATTRLIITPDTHERFYFMSVERYIGKERSLVNQKAV